MHSLDKRIFISKNAPEVEPYRIQFEEKGYSIVSHSFLSFAPVDFEITQTYDVVFFGSPRAVIFFKACQAIPENKRIACVGGKTAELLESIGHGVDFVGTKSSEPKLVAEEFKEWLTSAPLSQQASNSETDTPRPRVLFPVSDRSLKTISSVIDENQKEEVVVYSTKLVGRKVEACDVYVFTSPSNVDGFLMENVLPEGAKVIAWGKSTEKVLEERDVEVWKTLEKSGFEGLINHL